MLSIFPFERDWYSARVPELWVEFVGHPITIAMRFYFSTLDFQSSMPLVCFARSRERIERHLPVMVEAARRIAANKPIRFR